MNEFEYTLLDKKIDAFTTIKQHGECARELYNKLKSMDTPAWSTQIYVNIGAHSVTTYENIFKALSKTLLNYTGKSPLPGFIYTAHKNLHSALLAHYATEGTTYERLINVFQYEDTLELGWLHGKEVKILNNIIKDNDLPFKLDYSYYASDIYTNASSGFNINSSLNECLELENIKRTLPSDIRHTLLEELLTFHYSKITAVNTKVDSLPLFVQAMKHLVEVSETACKRIHSENFDE